MVVHCTGKAPKGVPCPFILAMRESTIHQKASSSFCSARTSKQGPLYPTLRANPFPEVTDLFCRLPLSTFFYRLEAANLEDLMRLSVRLGVRISHSSGFSRDVQSAPKQPKAGRLSRGSIPISGQPDSRDSALVKKKRELSSGLQPPSPPSLVLPLNIHVLGWEY